jgi:hypothetical protein
MTAAEAFQRAKAMSEATLAAMKQTAIDVATCELCEQEDPRRPLPRRSDHCA